MNTKIGRFLIFIMKENTRKIFAFIVYVYFIGIFMKIDLPLVLKIISFIVLMFIAVFGGTCIIGNNYRIIEQKVFGFRSWLYVFESGIIFI